PPDAGPPPPPAPQAGRAGRGCAGGAAPAARLYPRRTSGAGSIGEHRRRKLVARATARRSVEIPATEGEAIVHQCRAPAGQRRAVVSRSRTHARGERERGVYSSILPHAARGGQPMLREDADLVAAIGQRYEQELAAKDETIAALQRRVGAAEQERDLCRQALTARSSAPPRDAPRPPREDIL